MRELSDPHIPRLKWRLNGFVFEQCSYSDHWAPARAGVGHDGCAPSTCMSASTPERRALQRELFLRPCE